MREYLSAHLAAYPRTQPQDIVKLLYQSVCGAEHMLTDIERAHTYFMEEFAATPPADAPIVEAISPSVCRIHLGAWKAAGTDAEWLFRLFCASATIGGIEDTTTALTAALTEAEALLPSLAPAFSMEEFRTFLTEYRAAGMPSLHHSAIFRETYHPAYRIVRQPLCRICPILTALPPLMQTRRPVILAIDGRAASGKSTMADQLTAITGASVIHMDDFFLPPSLRTEERLHTPGGNVHYERFADEVLPHLRDQHGFSYTRFDCAKMELGSARFVAGHPIRIVEGSYACHPALGRYADLVIFSDVSPEEQITRIHHRNGEVMARRFQEEWIPMEEAYFHAYAIRRQADITL